MRNVSVKVMVLLLPMVLGTTWTKNPADPWPTVSSGDTVVLTAGEHLGTFTLPNSAAGTQQAPTIIRGETPGAVKVRGVSGDGDGLQIGTESVDPQGCHWVIVEDLEIYNSVRDGIRIYGNDVIVRRCNVHGNGAGERDPGGAFVDHPVGQGISSFGNHRRVTIEDCLVWNNGSGVFDHGLYCYGWDHTFRRLRVYRNTGSGLNLYDPMSGAVVENCVVLGNGLWGVYAKMRDGEATITITGSAILWNFQHGLSLIDGGGGPTPNIENNWIFGNVQGPAAFGGSMAPFPIETWPN